MSDYGIRTPDLTPWTKHTALWGFPRPPLQRLRCHGGGRCLLLGLSSGHDDPWHFRFIRGDVSILTSRRAMSARGCRRSMAG
ncbi:hypothetical protein FKM82_000248 [Ascaphus truei]